ncbi:hypothetical protein [Parasitella parasitica]|uniref:Uncharacterized protein n=1 Tax=Parasitella parasitica TaxID=35722 RepID=A0A0B7N7D2_9FUNG|nr:hypothetical protein [Parasitella parasitica]
MDNNPFRSHQSQTGNYMTPNMGGQSQQQPYQPNYNNNLPGGEYSSATSTMCYQQQQQQQQQPQQPQQQSWQYQQPQNNNIMSSAAPQQSSFTSTLLPHNSFASTHTTNTAPPSQFSPYASNATLMSPTTTSNINTNGFGTGGSNNVNGNGNTYQPYAMPTPNTDNYPNMNNNSMFGNPGFQQSYQHLQQHNDPSNFYIPPNFGMTTTSNNNGNMFSSQPRHAPVDVRSLLKGTQVRSVQCPVCQKTIEGDDMAVNHHVNEHYT